MWILPKQIQSTTSVYAQATRESELDSGEFCQMCEKSLMWRSKPSLSRTWSTRLKRGSFIKHLFTRTLKPSLTESFEDWWTSSVEDFPASRLVKPELEKLRKTQDTCSPLSQKESESANLELFSSKMSKESLAARPKTENQFSNMSSEHWKKWVTEQRQEYSQRVKSASHINEKGFTFWGTPAANDANKSLMSEINSKQGGLTKSVAKNWPTASVAGCVEGGVAKNVEMNEKGFSATRENGTKYGAKLRDAVIHHEKNWATPSTMDNLPARSPEKLAEAKKKGGCKNLREEVVNPKNWATPNTMDTLPPRSYEATQKQAMTARKGRNNPANLREQVDPTCVKAYKDVKNWGTPKEQDSRAKMEDRGKHNFPTPQASDGIKPAGPKGQKMLCNSVQNTQQDLMKSNTNGKSQGLLKLNPSWVEQLMGLPIGWTDCDFSEME